MAQAEPDEGLAHPSDNQLWWDPHTFYDLVFGRTHGSDGRGDEWDIIVDPGVEYPQDIWALQTREHMSFAYCDNLIGTG